MLRVRSPRFASLGAAVITGSLIAGTPALAMEAMRSAPVKITSCVVARDFTGNTDYARTANTAGVTIVVVNDSPKTIKDMQLSGVYDGLTITDTFTGPFAAGQTFTVRKEHVPLAYEGPDAMCVLNHVTYADGTDWTMAAPPARQR